MSKGFASDFSTSEVMATSRLRAPVKEGNSSITEEQHDADRGEFLFTLTSYIADS